MATRHITAATAMAALALAGTTGVAHAASQSVTENCSSNAWAYIPIALQVGDTLTIATNISGDCDRAGTFTGTGVAPQGVGTATAGATGTEIVLPYNAGTAAIAFGDRIIYTAMAVGSIRLQLQDYIFGDPTYYDITVTAASSNDPGSEPVTQSSPRDVLQQVGSPTGGCETVDDSTLNWAGVPSGEWRESWAQWSNGGLGGAVCSRTLTYVAGGWRVTS